jgi:hypothetical protein
LRPFLHVLELAWHGWKPKIMINCYERQWKAKRISYHFKYFIIKLNTNITRSTDLDPCLAYRFPVFGSRGPGLNSHDLGLVD